MDFFIDSWGDFSTMVSSSGCLGLESPPDGLFKELSTSEASPQTDT